MLVINLNNLDMLPTSIGAKICVIGLHSDLMTELHRRGFWVEKATHTTAVLRRDFPNEALVRGQF